MWIRGVGRYKVENKPFHKLHTHKPFSFKCIHWPIYRRRAHLSSKLCCPGNPVNIPDTSNSERVTDTVIHKQTSNTFIDPTHVLQNNIHIDILKMHAHKKRETQHIIWQNFKCFYKTSLYTSKTKGSSITHRSFYTFSKQNYPHMNIAKHSYAYVYK